MTSVYQQVRDYFITRDLYSTEMIVSHCSQKISREALKKYFGETVRKHDIPRFRKRYEKECTDALTKIAQENQVGGEFWETRLGSALTNFGSIVYESMTAERVFELESAYSIGKWVPKLEAFLNMLAFTGSFFLPWSMFITFYPSGRKLITDLFSKPGISSVIAFYCVLYTIRTQEAYDDYFFKEEIVRMIPYVSLPETIIKTLDLPLLIGRVVDDKLIQNWYHYITLNLVSQTSLKKTASLLDAKLTNAFLQSLADALETYINEQKDVYLKRTETIISKLQAKMHLRTRQVFQVLNASRSTIRESQFFSGSETTRALLADPSPKF